ncbi:hypothetical protein BD289DRAFT_371465 [Coniella lustricola]|uniref:SET domain-containing protein n=1 Tax=Coniella lustricola TaxID=2025994 RepID=A0A2T3A3N9_9PEZI|nr:hypothetical protein BD289DRAFT_371465 [Coniella lustricola]
MLAKITFATCLTAATHVVATTSIPDITAENVITQANLCLSSPILAAQYSSSVWQCPSNAAGNTNSSTLLHYKAELPEEETSGGWTGPHTCEGMYCVYSNADFAAGRGVAIISDGQTANAIANLPVLVELSSSSAGPLLQAARINVQSPKVDTQDIPGKGRGLVANQSIHRGEQLLAYTPALIIHRAFVDDLSKDAQLRLLQDAVSRLPTTTRDRFWQQLGHTHETGDDDILDIVMNNSFNLPIELPGDGYQAASFIGNFPEVSMYNHDCRPNAAFHLEGGLIHRTYAVQKPMHIQAGQELSISYVDSFRVRDVRRARTHRNWGFECTCAQCMLPETLANASDHRLWRIHEVETTLWPGEARVDRLDAVELLLSLYEQEHLLQSHGSPAYRISALSFNSSGRKEMAIKYALLALEAGIVEGGAQSAAVQEMLSLLDQPEAHWSWQRSMA